MADNDQYEKSYSDSGFWEKLKNVAKVAGKQVLELALQMYYAARDTDTPLWAKTTIYGALGYFISPVDLIPDIIPFAGFSDDLSVLAAAVAAVAMYIKQEHKTKAQDKLRTWFD